MSAQITVYSEKTKNLYVKQTIAYCWEAQALKHGLFKIVAAGAYQDLVERIWF